MNETNYHRGIPVTIRGDKIYHGKHEIKIINNKLYYSYWEIIDELPVGWIIDNISGSPLWGHKFIIDKPPLKGGKTKLIQIISRWVQNERTH